MEAIQLISDSLSGIFSTEQNGEEGKKASLPPLSATGMMRWKQWWWNHPQGLRQCDAPGGGKKTLKDSEKVEAIKRAWQGVETDQTLLAYIREVHHHAKTHEWTGEDGQIYGFCELYQSDLQSVLDFLERKLAARQQQEKKKKSAPPPSRKAERVRPDDQGKKISLKGGSSGAGSADGSSKSSVSPEPHMAQKTISSAAKAKPKGGRATMTTPIGNSPDTWEQPSENEFPEVWLRGARVDAAPNEELREMFFYDQQDRMPPKGQDIDWAVVGPRDDARRRRVLEILAEEDGCVAPLDFYHAAFMCHHASAEEVDFYRAANFLALEAVRLDPTNRRYRWLFAAAKDRLLRGLGKPQLFGIQKSCPARGGWWIPNGVESWVTEEMRKEWAAPTLREVGRRRGRRLIEKE